MSNHLTSYLNRNLNSSYLNIINNFLKEGTILNKRYIVKRGLVQTQMNLNYLAFDKKNNLNVFIKELFPKSLAYRNSNFTLVEIKKTDVELFELVKLNSFNVLNVLQSFGSNNNNITKIFEIFNENNTIYCVEEIPNGLTLTKFLSNNYGEVSWNNSKNMFLNLIKFMQNLHKVGIIHCGLNPNTVLVQNNSFKLIDFSNSVFDSNSKILKIKPFDGYSPLELYNDGKIGSFTDVYAIAAILYKSLTGTKPVSSCSRVLNDNLLPPQNLNSNVPKTVSIAIMSGLMISSKLRTQTMFDFYSDLTAVSRNSYKSIILSSNNYNSKHINTIEPIKNLNKKLNIKNQHKEIKTSNLIFITIIMSSSVVLFTAAIIIFILFQNSIF